MAKPPNKKSIVGVRLELYCTKSVAKHANPLYFPAIETMWFLRLEECLRLTTISSFGMIFTGLLNTPLSNNAMDVLLSLTTICKSFFLVAPICKAFQYLYYLHVKQSIALP